MRRCEKCGYESNDEATVCENCGEVLNALQQQQPQQQSQPQQQPQRPMGMSPNLIRAREALRTHYVGTERVFSFQGRNYVVPKGMDCFNYYRRLFYVAAHELSLCLNREFSERIHDLDSYLAYFPEMYARYREPLIITASNLLIDAGVYDVPQDLFRETHTEDFCLCNVDMQVTIDSFNLTIEENQRRIVRNYNMMPGLIFSGLAGIVAATAVNVAVASISESQIRNANVSQAQRRELFGRIKIPILLEHAFYDYWRVFCSMTWWMNKRGLDVWYPTTEGNQRADGLFKNLCNNRLPADRTPDFLLDILRATPYNKEYYKYMLARYGDTPEIMALREYYGYVDFNNPRL